MRLHTSEESPLSAFLERIKIRLHLSFAHPEDEAVCDIDESEVMPTIGESVLPVLPRDTERTLVAPLLRRLRRSRFLKNCPGPLKEDTALMQSTADYLLHTLRHTGLTKWKERLIAAWALGSLPSHHAYREEAAEHLEYLVKVPHKDILVPKKKRMVKVWWAFFTAAIFPLAIYQLSPTAVIRFDIIGNDLDIQPVALLILMTVILSVLGSTLLAIISLPAFVALDAMRANLIRSRALLTLGRWRDARHLPVILRGYLGLSSRVSRAASIALMESLPLLTVEDFGNMPGSFGPDLCRAISICEARVIIHDERGLDLEYLLLAAIGKVGDGRCIATVTTIADGRRTPRLQKLAESILPILRERERQRNEQSQLLRGSSSPPVTSDTLLRSAGNTVTPPDSLLRSSQAPDAEQIQSTFIGP